MISSTWDAVLFLKTIQKHLFRGRATYINDTLHAGEEEYSKLTEESEQKFKCIPKPF